MSLWKRGIPPVGRVGLFRVPPVLQVSVSVNSARWVGPTGRTGSLVQYFSSIVRLRRVSLPATYVISSFLYLCSSCDTCSGGFVPIKPKMRFGGKTNKQTNKQFLKNSCDIWANSEMQNIPYFSVTFIEHFPDIWVDFWQFSLNIEYINSCLPQTFLQVQLKPRLWKLNVKLNVINCKSKQVVWFCVFLISRMEKYEIFNTFH